MGVTLSPSSSSAAARFPIGQKGPRGDVLAQLKLQPLASKDLASRLGLSLNAVRHHLKELEAEGLVSYERENRGVGAPAFLYRLSPSGEALFPRRYEEALGDLLRRLVDHEGREAAVGHLQGYFGTLARRVTAALEVIPAEDEAPAVAVVTGQFPDICAAEARFLADVLKAEVVRREHVLSGCTTCEHHERFRSAEELA
ncbi:MAG: helix-turn-helix domain-containing protein [Gemmatimonadales bacterium]